VATYQTGPDLDHPEPQSLLLSLVESKRVHILILFWVALWSLQIGCLLPRDCTFTCPVYAISFHDRDLLEPVSTRLTGDFGKKAGAIHVNLLRAILLMEVDFNAAMKILIGHRMICNAIKAWAVPQECFGSLPEHTTIQVSLNWCLIVDTSRQ